MAITQALCTSFRAEILLAVHDFRASTGDTFKIALYTSSATLDATTTAYTATNEISSAGYSAGGITLTNNGVTSLTGVGWLDFADVTVSGGTFTTRGGLIYNNTPSANGEAGDALTNPAVAVLDFGGDKTVTAGDFTIIFPADGSTTAIIRIA